MTASQKIHLSREARDCASSFVIAAYVYVRLIPQDSRALHLELFTVPSTLATSYEVVKKGSPRQNGGFRYERRRFFLDKGKGVAIGYGLGSCAVVLPSSRLLDRGP